MALGDGANDLKMLGEAGIGIAYHAKPIVRAQAKYSLNLCWLGGVVELVCCISLSCRIKMQHKSAMI